MYLPGTPWAMAQYSVVKHHTAPLHYRQILYSRVLAGTFANNNFSIFSASGAPFASDILAPIGIAGTFRHLCFKFNSDPDSGGSSKGWNITLNKNIVAQAVSVAILSSDSGTSFAKCYTGAGVHFSATDNPEYVITAAAGGAGANTPIGSATIEFEPDANDGTTVLLGDNAGNSLPTTNNYYLSFSSVGGFTTENTRMTVFPMDGTITSFFFKTNNAVTGTQTRTYTLRKTTGSGAGTTTSCTSNACGGTDAAILYSSGGTSFGVQQVAENIPITAGDRIDIIQNTANTPTLAQGGWGILFKPTTGGQYIINAINMTASNSSSVYGPLDGYSPSATEATVQVISITDTTLQGFTMCGTVSPGAGSYALSLRENAGAAPTTYSTTANSGSYCPVTSANTSYAIPTNFNLYDTVITPSSSPTVSAFMVSYLGYTAP